MGGIRLLKLEENGFSHIFKSDLYNKIYEKLQKRSFLVYTNISRSSSEIQEEVDKDPEKALKLVEKCLELFPEFHNAVKDYEILRYELGKPGAKEPDSFRRRRLAKELVSESIGISFVDSSQALKMVKKAIEMDPSYREAYSERDLLEFFLENGKLAAEANTEEIAERIFSQGREMQEHNPEKAMSLMRATLEIKPDHQEAIKWLNNLEEYALLETHRFYTWN